jgi:hypothetical protein
MKNRNRIFLILMSSFIFLTISCTSTNQVDSPNQKDIIESNYLRMRTSNWDTIFPFRFPILNMQLINSNKQQNGGLLDLY